MDPAARLRRACCTEGFAPVTRRMDPAIQHQACALRWFGTRRVDGWAVFLRRNAPELAANRSPRWKPGLISAFGGVFSPDPPLRRAAVLTGPMAAAQPLGLALPSRCGDEPPQNPSNEDPNADRGSDQVDRDSPRG